MKKNKKYVVAAVVAAAVLGAGWLYFGTGRVIAVTGECNTKIQRNKFSITFDIKSLDKDAVVSMRDVQNAADEVVKHIKKIDDKTLEIQTKDISSYEKTKWEKNTQVSLGIESEIRLEIMTKQKETITAILGGMPAVKNAKILPQRMINFSSRSAIDAAMEECLQLAMADARNKASAIATADGEKLGRLIFAQFGPSSGDNGIVQARVSFANVMRAPMAAAAESAGDFVQSSDGELSVRIETIFRIR